MSQVHALEISVVVEAVTAFFFVVVIARATPAIARKTMLAIAAATLISHPTVWILNQQFAHVASYSVRVVILECLVIFVESVLLAFATPLYSRQCFALSASANAMSFLSGLLLVRMI